MVAEDALVALVAVAELPEHAAAVVAVAELPEHDAAVVAVAAFPVIPIAQPEPFAPDPVNDGA